jgi:hypothetical protein
LRWISGEKRKEFAARSNSYSTTFPLTENPISEGESWTNGGATGLGWANVQTTPGLSFGTGPVNAGTYLYADPIAVLKGACMGARPTNTSNRQSSRRFSVVPAAKKWNSSYA